ncbi:MAG: hypothetical protein QXI09_00200 [Candidatus Aenigmatarchaeota archaeon]
MKKLIIFILLSLVVIPLVKAQLLCDESSYPFRLCQVVQNFTNVVAGAPITSRVSFKYIGNEWAPLVVRVNVSSEGYLFSENDFIGYGNLLTQALNGPITQEISLTCVLPPVTFEQIGETFKSSIPNNFTLYCYNPEFFYIVMPSSFNYVTITLIPNVALTPATFDFTIELMTDIGVPILEPTVNVINGYGSLIINPPFEKIEFISYPQQNITIKALIYSSIFFKGVPTNSPFPVIYFDLINQTSFNGSIEVRYYFDRDVLIAKGWDISKLTFYRLYITNGTASWVQMFSKVTDNYVSMNVTSLSVYGVFTSFYYPPRVTYVSYPTYVTTITNVTNITETRFIERPIERVIEEKIPPSPICGNGYCEAGETCSSCPEDCVCPSGTKCIANVCTAIIQPTPAGLTGLVILVTSPLGIAIIFIIMVFIVLLILVKKKKI